MNEKLKQEAEEKSIAEYGCKFDGFIRGYLASAEPREKRIAELERKLKVETELSNRLGLAYREYEELTKEQDEHLAELEQENAELKDDNLVMTKILTARKYKSNNPFTKYMQKNIEERYVVYHEDWKKFEEIKQKLIAEGYEVRV